MLSRSSFWDGVWLYITVFFVPIPEWRSKGFSRLTRTCRRFSRNKLGGKPTKNVTHFTQNVCCMLGSVHTKRNTFPTPQLFSSPRRDVERITDGSMRYHKNERVPFYRWTLPFHADVLCFTISTQWSVWLRYSPPFFLTPPPPLYLCRVVWQSLPAYWIELMKHSRSRNRTVQGSGVGVDMDTTICASGFV